MDYFEQVLCIGDRVAFVTNKRSLQMAQIVSFRGEDPYRLVTLHTDGNRTTEVRCNRVIKEPV